jgi:hypothetical protein
MMRSVLFNDAFSTAVLSDMNSKTIKNDKFRNIWMEAYCLISSYYLIIYPERLKKTVFII